MTVTKKLLLLAVLATVISLPVTTMQAGATTSGHFVSNSPSEMTTLVGEELGHPGVEIGGGAIASPIHCTNASYHGSVSGSTVQSVKIVPVYSGCTTTKGIAVTITFNGCTYIATSRSLGEATAGLECPAGKQVEVHDNETGCRLSLPTQKLAKAATYTTETFNGHHSIIVEIVVGGIAYTAHGAKCPSASTSRNDLGFIGIIEFHGTNPFTEELVDITAT